MMNGNFLKILFILSLLGNTVFGGYIINKYWMEDLNDKPYAGNSTVDTKRHFCGKNLLFESMPEDSTNIVFLGDSFIDNFYLSELYQNLKIKNRGVQGEYTSGVLDLIPVVVDGQPSELFIYAGVNDVISDVSKEETYDNYGKIIKLIREITPETKIHMISVLPIKDNSSYCINCNDEIIALNKHIYKVCEENEVEFIDIYNEFSQRNEIDDNYVTKDGLHLNAQGYLKFKKLLDRYIYL